MSNSMNYYHCSACQWSGPEPDWTDSTPLEMPEGQFEGRKPLTSGYYLCPHCGQEIK